MAQSMGLLSLGRAINGCPSSDVLAPGLWVLLQLCSGVRCPLSVRGRP